MNIEPRRFSLRFKIAVIVLLVSLTSVWLLTFTFLNSLERDMRRVLKEQQQSTVSYIASDIDAKLQQRISLLNKNAPLVAERIDSAKMLRDFLKERIGLHALFSGGLLVVDKHARGIAAYRIKPNAPGMSFKDMDYFQEALSTGRTVIGKPRTCMLTKVPVVPIATPVRSPSGKMQGILVGFSMLSDKNLFEHVEHVSTKEAGELFVFSPLHSLIITSNDPAYILKPLAYSNLMMDSHPGVAQSAKALISIQTIPTAGWFIKMTTPAEKVFAPIQDTWIRAFGIAGVLTFLTIIAIWFAVKNTLGPLEKVSTVIQKMASGNGRLHQLPIFGDKEIKSLLESFNQLVEQRHHFEQITRTSEARLTRAELVSKMGHWELHPGGKTVSGSKGAMQIYGLNDRTFDLATIQSMSLHEYRPLLDASLEALLKHGSPYDVEFKIRAADTGEIKDIHSQAIFDEDRKIVFGTIQDITERKRYEGQLRESEARYRLLADNSHDTIWTMDLATRRFTYVSPSVVKLRGYTAEEVMAQTLDESMTPQALTVANKAIADLFERLKTGDRDNLSAVMEMEQPHRDGHLVPTEVVATCVLDELGYPKTIVGITRDITERRKAQEMLERMAHSDPLTGLANRRHFMTLARQELARTIRYGGELSILMMDIDHFKSINDTYGHTTGDWVIQKIGEVCKETLREIDVTARIGGEEFAIMLPQTGKTRAVAAAERLREIIAEISNPSNAEPNLTFTVSIGVATLSHATTDMDTLLSFADKALYKAKHAGRNRVWVYDEREPS